MPTPKKPGTRGGRPTLPAAEKLGIRRALFLNQADEARVKKLMEATGRSFSEVVRLMISSRPLFVTNPFIVEPELSKNLIGMNRIGNVLRLIARKPGLNPAEHAFLFSDQAALGKSITALDELIHRSTRTCEELYDLQMMRREVLEQIETIEGLLLDKTGLKPLPGQQKILAALRKQRQLLDRLATHLNHYCQVLEES